MKHIVTIRYPGEFIKAFPMDSDKTPSQLLEQIFDEWNAGSRRESHLFLTSHCRSLSVNDIVTIDGKDYQCKSCGWEEVSFEYTDQLEEEVRQHPAFTQCPFFALSRIMSDRWWKNYVDSILGIDI
jgi:hypothetical protein